MRIKDELSFARTGYDLLDQKRSILVSELLTLVDQAVDYQNRVERELGEAEDALENAIMHMGRLKVANLAGAVNISSSITLGSRRVMGVELPTVSTEFLGSGPFFSPEGTSMLSEIAVDKFRVHTKDGIKQQNIDRLKAYKEKLVRIKKDEKVEGVAQPGLFALPKADQEVKWRVISQEDKKREIVKAKRAAIKEWKDKIKAKKEAKHKK